MAIAAHTEAQVGLGHLAEKLLIRASQMDRPPVDIYYHLGWVYEQNGRLAEAFREYERGYNALLTDRSHFLFDLFAEAMKRLRSKMDTR